MVCVPHPSIYLRCARLMSIAQPSGRKDSGLQNSFRRSRRNQHASRVRSPDEECDALQRRYKYKKSPAPKAFGAGFWRRPTLARPFVALPSGLQRFTAVFGMGTGGATALLSPEGRRICELRLPICDFALAHGSICSLRSLWRPRLLNC
jgi:hypothetical protein